MSVRTVTFAAIVLPLCVAGGTLPRAEAQLPTQKSAPKQAAPKPAGTDDSARKAEILSSPQWRRAMFEFKEWLSAQPLYDAQQVEQFKARFNQRVAAMTAGEVEFLLQDMQAKFQILDSPEAREARTWMAQYLSVMSDKKRAEVLKDIPNLGTMTAAQLGQEVAKIEQARSTIDQEQAAFSRTRQTEVNAQLQQDRTAQQNYIRDRNSAPTTYSPYHSPSDVNKRLNEAPIGSGMGFYVNPSGGVGLTFGPSSW